MKTGLQFAYSGRCNNLVSQMMRRCQDWVEHNLPSDSKLCQMLNKIWWVMNLCIIYIIPFLSDMWITDVNHEWSLLPSWCLLTVSPTVASIKCDFSPLSVTGHECSCLLSGWMCKQHEFLSICKQGSSKLDNCLV